MLDWLDAISAACPDSHLPFAGRDLWHHEADAAVLDMMGTDTAAVMASGCAPHLHGGRACVVFVHTYASAAAVAPAVALLDKHPQLRLLLLSSSHYDTCAAGLSEAPEGAHPLFDHPRFVAWYGENPCFAHAKLVALPIGAKFNWASNKFLEPEPKAPIKRALLSAMRSASDAARTAALLAAASLDTTDYTDFKRHTKLRRVHAARMEALARDAARDWGLAVPPAGMLAHEAYLRALAQMRFAWAPPGAGIDTHRTWECLLVGCAPLLLASPLDALHTHFPRAVVVRDYNDTTELSPATLQGVWGEFNHADGAWLSPHLFGFLWLDEIERVAGAAIHGSG